MAKKIQLKNVPFVNKIESLLGADANNNFAQITPKDLVPVEGDRPIPLQMVINTLGPADEDFHDLDKCAVVKLLSVDGKYPANVGDEFYLWTTTRPNFKSQSSSSSSSSPMLCDQGVVKVRVAKAVINNTGERILVTAGRYTWKSHKFINPATSQIPAIPENTPLFEFIYKRFIGDTDKIYPYFRGRRKTKSRTCSTRRTFGMSRTLDTSGIQYFTFELRNIINTIYDFATLKASIRKIGDATYCTKVRFYSRPS
ncbi:MAG: hypothetical protein HDT28_05025 [Clostridiales bacterium]|nr:hypothetical protein [Clostridiales bacterium]